MDEGPALVVGRHGLALAGRQVRTTGRFELARDEVGTLEVVARATGPAQLLIGWSDDADAPRMRRHGIRLDLERDGARHAYVVDASGAMLRGLAPGQAARRLFLAGSGEGSVEIESLVVKPRRARFATRPWGTLAEVRDGESRAALFLRPDTTLAWDVDVPATRPVLEAALASASGDGVVEVEVALEADGARHVLAKRLVREAPWEDVVLDLAPWAGRRVRLAFSVRGTRDAAALWSSPTVRGAADAAANRPFLVLVEDALRADRLSSYGGAVATPAHDALAASGLLFERAFAQAPQTRPSVASMMTSLLPSATGVHDFSDALAEPWVTLAEVLRACGFATASFVQNGNAGAYAGLAQGFDVVMAEDRFGPRAADILGESSPLQEWIRRHHGRAWFAYVHVLDPHGPYDPAVRPPLDDAAGPPGLLPDRSIDPAWLSPPTAEARRRLYDAEVAANDAALAAFLGRLEASGDAAGAVVAVVADHGEFLGEHGGLWRHHPPAHVEVARVPFLLKAPGVAPRRIRGAVALLDLMPTLLDLAGIHAPTLVMQGRSLAPLLRGDAAAEDRVVLADEMTAAGGRRDARGCGSFASADQLWLLSCTRDADYPPDRLLPLPSPGPAPPRRFILDAAGGAAEADTTGLVDRAASALARRALEDGQRAGLEAWRRLRGLGDDAMRSEPETSERLRALGYVE